MSATRRLCTCYAARTMRANSASPHPPDFDGRKVLAALHTSSASESEHQAAQGRCAEALRRAARGATASAPALAPGGVAAYEDGSGRVFVCPIGAVDAESVTLLRWRDGKGARVPSDEVFGVFPRDKVRPMRTETLGEPEAA